MALEDKNITDTALNAVMKQQLGITAEEESRASADAIISEDISNIQTIVYEEKEMIGDKFLDGTASSASSAFMQYYLFGKNGWLHEVNVQLITQTDIILYVFEKTGEDTWTEKNRETITGLIAGNNTVNLLDLKIKINENDCIGFKGVTAGIIFKQEDGFSYFSFNPDTFPYSFTRTGFPEIPSANSFKFAIEFTSISNVSYEMYSALKVEVDVNTSQSKLNKNNIETLEDSVDGLVSITALTTLEKQIKNNFGVYVSLTVKKDGTGDYTSLYDACEYAATIATPYNKVEVVIYDDWSFTEISDYGTKGASYHVGCTISDNMILRGDGAMKTIFATLPTNLTLSEYSLRQPIYMEGSAKLINLNIIAENIRYAVHYDAGNAEINKNRTVITENCKLTHAGVSSDIAIGDRWPYQDAWGSGTAGGSIFIFKNTELKATRYPIRIHGNVNYLQPNKFVFYNSYFSCLDNETAFYIDARGDNQTRIIELNNNNIGGVFYVNSLYEPAQIIDKINPCPQISGQGNTPFCFSSGLLGSSLRVTSQSTGLSSVVKVVQDDADLFGSVIVSTGSLGLSGCCYGDNELITSNGLDKSCMIGHRLGDCTTVNKLLILEIDGTNRTVTFNLDYSGGDTSVVPVIDDATILSAINLAISTHAVADYYQVNADYYPELSDVLYLKLNSEASYIEKGLSVKFTGMNSVRLAVAGEVSDGIAIESIGVDTIGRCIQNTIVSKSEQFAPQMESTSFSIDDKFKISANGKLEKDNTITIAEASAIAVSSDLLKLN